MIWKLEYSTEICTSLISVNDGNGGREIITDIRHDIRRWFQIRGLRLHEAWDYTMILQGPFAGVTFHFLNKRDAIKFRLRWPRGAYETNNPN